MITRDAQLCAKALVQTCRSSPRRLHGPSKRRLVQILPSPACMERSTPQPAAGRVASLEYAFILLTMPYGSSVRLLALGLVAGCLLSATTRMNHVTGVTPRRLPSDPVSCRRTASATPPKSPGQIQGHRSEPASHPWELPHPASVGSRPAVLRAAYLRSTHTRAPRAWRS